MENEIKMNISLGTGNLGKNYNLSSHNTVNYCISKDYPLHISLDYNVNKKFLNIDNFENFQPKFILKITVIKNIFKLKKHIEKQINEFLELYNLKTIGYIQLCNNPSKNFIYQFFLKKIISKYLKKKIISKVYLDVFPDYEKNLIFYLNDKFYDGYVFLFNYETRSISKNFFSKIIESQKSIIVYSPFANGELLKNGEKNVLNHLRFFNTISKSIKYIVFGSKNLERIKFIESNLNLKENILDNNIFNDIIINQKIFNKY